RKIRIFQTLGAVAARECQQLRCSDRQWPLDLQQLRNMACTPRRAYSVHGFYPWHAGPLVQTAIPAETPEEVAVLAMGRVPRAARCERGSVYLRRGASSGPRIVLFVSLQRGDRGPGHCVP